MSALADRSATSRPPSAPARPGRRLHLDWRVRFAVLSLIWGFSFLFIKVGTEAFAPLQITLARTVFGGAVLAAVLLARRERLPRRPRTWACLAVAAVLLCALPFSLFAYAVLALTHNSAIWNNLAAAISRSRIPYVRLQLDRGRRLAGRSHMNFVSLALHGISAISVYAEVALVRMIVFACIICGITLTAGLVVVSVRLGTDWAVPGWASYVMASLAVIFLQALVLGAISVFQLLNTRILKAFIPAVDATIFVVDEKEDNRLPHVAKDTP